MNPKIEKALAFWQKKINEYYAERFPNLVPPTLSLKYGRKYIKVIAERRGGGYGDRYVHSFFDAAGNIYRAASWQAPAKHVRGHVDDPDYSWGRGVNEYGGTYLK